MRNYKKLIEALRTMSEKSQALFVIMGSKGNDKLCLLFRDAADAIEELQAAFCLLCGICTSPPSAETFNSCEIVRGCLPEPPKEVE